LNKAAKKLYNKAHRLWKEVCFLRDGKECQVKKHFPEINITHTNVIQVDHGISRANKHFFFDTRHATPVCSACNYAKKFKLKSVDRAIDELITRRIGYDAFQEMVFQDKSGSPNLAWGKVWWLEGVVEHLQNLKKELEK